MPEVDLGPCERLDLLQPRGAISGERQGSASGSSRSARSRDNSRGVATRSRSPDSAAGRRTSEAGSSAALSRSIAHRYRERTALMIEAIREAESPSRRNPSTASCRSPLRIPPRGFLRIATGNLLREESRFTIAFGL